MRSSYVRRERLDRAAVTDCAARTLARRLLQGLEHARNVIDVAILTVRYYEEPTSGGTEEECARNAEKTKQLLAAFGNGAMKEDGEAGR